MRDEFPADKPIHVKCCITPYDHGLTPRKRFDGDCCEKEDCYEIRVYKKLSVAEKKDTLMHEWAHCLAGWDDEHDSHSNKWGIAYARIYREMVGD